MAWQTYPREQKKSPGDKRSKSKPLARALHINGAEWRWEVDEPHFRVKIAPMSTRELMFVDYADLFGIDDPAAKNDWRDYRKYNAHPSSITPGMVKKYIEDRMMVSAMFGALSK